MLEDLMGMRDVEGAVLEGQAVGVRRGEGDVGCGRLGPPLLSLAHDIDRGVNSDDRAR